MPISMPARRFALPLCLMLVLAGCTTGQVGVGPQPASGASSSFVLKFAVGTATIGTTLGTSVVGFNAVATFRQANAQNATAANTPTLSGPASFAGMHSITGITPGQLAAAAATAAQNGVPFAPARDQLLGVKMGVFGDGFDQLNLVDIQTYDAAFPGSQGFGFDTCGPLLDGTGETTNGQTQGFEYTAIPLQVTLPCAEAGQGVPGIVRQAYYAGAPAWPSPQGYGLPTGFVGYPLGFTDFDDVKPVPGTYHLDVAYSVNAQASAYAHVAANATLTKITPLPAFATPIVAPQPDGSALVTLSVPAGASEAVVLIDDDSCQLSAGGLTTQRYFALLTRQSGPQTLLLSAKLGPPDSSGNPTDTFCTAADDALPNASSNHHYVVSAVGFDYPAYEASYPMSTTPSPVVGNALGQADVTTSAPADVDYALGAP
jgi:hypothetical protein